MKKVPMRTCVVTREVKPKKELIRICATKDNVVSVDLTGKAHGRGDTSIYQRMLFKGEKDKSLIKIKCKSPWLYLWRVVKIIMNNLG